MEKVFTLSESVKKYGSKAQKKSFKEKGNLSGKEFAILLKSIAQEWESFTVEGRGSKRIIICSGKRSKKVERVDKRSNNGQGQLIGEFELNSLVVNYLIQNDNKVNPMSATKWLAELGVVDRKLSSALYSAKDKHLEQLQEQFGMFIKDYNKCNSDLDMLNEFLQVTMKSMKSSILSVFTKLVKANVITHQKEKWGCTSNSNHRKLTRSEVKEIASIRHLLLTKYDLKSNELFKTNKKEVKAYKEEFDKQLVEELDLRYYYDAHFCLLQESDLGVKEYLERLQEKGELNFTYSLTEEYAFYMVQYYLNLHNKHSLNLAKEREKNIYNRSDSDRVRQLKVMKQYAPMWELLVNYFRCANGIDSNQPPIEKEPIIVNIDGVEIEMPNESTKANPLNVFEGIRFITEIESNQLQEIK